MTRFQRSLIYYLGQSLTEQKYHTTMPERQSQAGPNLQTQTEETTPTPVLHLRPRSEKEKQKKKSRSQVRWTDDVVDNEHMNKKKSKICCIFHPQREFGECSSDSDSGSSDSSSDESGDERGRPCNHNHDHNHNHEHDHAQSKGNGKVKKARESSPNAYERQPHYKNMSKVPEDS